MAKKVYVGDGVARLSKKIYVGVETEVPIYQETVNTVNVTASNISSVFTVKNGTYYFAGSGSTFTSNNGGQKSTTATTELIAKTNMDITFKYSYSSEANYDKFTLTVAGRVIENAVSGSTTTKSYNGSLTVGQSIIFEYAKDTSTDNNDDKCTFSNMVVTGTIKTQIGSETKDAYVGDANGIARLFYSTGIPLAELPVGSLVSLNESGSPVNFYVAKHDYESGLNGAGRTLLVRKNLHSKIQWHTEHEVKYASSNIDSWLNSTYRLTLDSAIRSAIGTTKFYYDPSQLKEDASTLSRSVFLLSVTELNLAKDGWQVDSGYVTQLGTALPIASTLQNAYLDGSSDIESQWTRTPYNYMTYEERYAVVVGNSNWDYKYVTYLNGVRPVFTLPETMEVNSTPNADGSYTVLV